jgi:ABC-2 type transport system ATP-binding protein
MFEGRILAVDTPENLQRLMTSSIQIIAEIAAPIEALRESFAQQTEILQFEVSAGDGPFHRCALTPRDGIDLRTLIFGIASDRGWVLRELTRRRHSLEDIYVQITRPDEVEE